jgi:predicted phage baseplate assembly protein
VALPEIVLDNRTFETIVAEARRRIPGYTPEWTDLNDSDPGMTLVQLFAWLSEMIIWRLDMVPDKHYLKFLDLIGITLAPARPATVDLTFALSAKQLGSITIPKGTRVSLADAAGGPVVFETDDNLEAISGSLVAVQSFDGVQYDVLTESNRQESNYFYPFGRRPQEGSALYLGVDEAFPSGKRHRLTVYPYTKDLIAEGVAIGGAALATLAPPIVAAWEYWAGDTGKWKPLSVVEDTTASLTRSGTVAFDAPASGAMQSTKIGLLKKDADPALFWLRYRIVHVLGRGFEVVPRLEQILVNTIAATNAETVSRELLGPSNGQPAQRFRLANHPVLMRPGSLEHGINDADIEVEVMEAVDEDFRLWQQKSDFVDSKPTDRHYTVDASEGMVIFGDGKQGMIPPAIFDTQLGSPETTRTTPIANVRANRYRWGGGANGNAGPGKITSLDSPIPFVGSVTNFRPSVGGGDQETIESARSRAPREIRSRSRAVTADDFEFLAQQTPGGRIRRAKALPLRHPTIEPERPAGAGLAATAVPVPGVVTVIVVPDSTDAQPMPSEETLNLVWRWLDGHRLITTEVYVAAPKYRKVEIEVRVIAKPTADSGIVERELKLRLLDYFHPLKGGADGTGWPFGQTIFFSETYRQIFTTPGVLRLDANAMTTYLDGEPQKPCADIQLGPDQLIWSDTHSVDVSYE